MFEEVDAALGEKLSKLIFEGPEAELTLTANAQPALMATSMAALRALETEAGFDVARDAAFVAGHSLGEYSALCAAGALTLADTAKLLRLRGEAMQQAVPAGEGAMAAILGLDFAKVSNIALEAARELYLTGAICEAANDNGGGQVVISGTRRRSSGRWSWRRSPAPSARCRSPSPRRSIATLMTPAAEAMAEALAKTTIAAPKVPLVANVSASALTDPAAIRESLVKQVTGAVRWRESVAFMAGQGVTRFVEVGAGKVLAGLVKRIAEGASAVSVGTPADVEAFKAAR